MAAGPAIFAAYNGANNQPDPIKAFMLSMNNVAGERRRED
jgi:hypothetical protein